MRKSIWDMAKHCFTSQRGNLNMAMGTDLFATLLLVFIISTAILLKAPKEGAVKADEMKTPDIALPKSTNSGRPSGSEEKSTTVSAKQNASGLIEYYIGNQKTELNNIAEVLKNKDISRVEMRLEEFLTNAITIEILSQLQTADVKDINYIFVKREGGKNHE